MLSPAALSLSRAAGPVASGVFVMVPFDPLLHVPARLGQIQGPRARPGVTAVSMTALIIDRATPSGAVPIDPKGCSSSTEARSRRPVPPSAGRGVHQRGRST